jgi:hypothetical protein
MKNRKAIVTISIGETYHANWKQFCEPNWKTYADKYSFDLICLEQPLDSSKMARDRSVAWQKCLILGQDFASDYDQIVWIDSDIMINSRHAPDITIGVPLEKVGGVREDSYYDGVFLQRAFKLWPGSVLNYTPQEYYTKYGLPGGCDEVLNTGVMVLSPTFHRTILEHVYSSYEEKGGREWHMEMRPLSYELVKAGAAHWIDWRFNVVWPAEEIVRYPFLLSPAEAPRGLTARIKRKLQKIGKSSHSENLRAACLNATFQISFFFHFGGMKTHEMQLVNQRPTTWWDVLD